MSKAERDRDRVPSHRRTTKHWSFGAEHKQAHRSVRHDGRRRTISIQSKPPSPEPKAWSCALRSSLTLKGITPIAEDFIPASLARSCLLRSRFSSLRVSTSTSTQQGQGHADKTNVKYARQRSRAERTQRDTARVERKCSRCVTSYHTIHQHGTKLQSTMRCTTSRLCPQKSVNQHCRWPLSTA